MSGVPDFEGPFHDRPLPDWFSRSKSLLPACRHWREPVVLVDDIVVFASAWFDRPMTGRGMDMSWPDVGFYLDAWSRWDQRFACLSMTPRARVGQPPRVPYEGGGV